MFRTATALLVLVVFVCVSSVNAAITRTENFDVDPGWTVVGSDDGNDFGYQTSFYAGGSPGEGGGRFTRYNLVKYYADTNLGGTLNLDQPFSASGRFDYTVQSTADFGYTNMLGHFSTSGFGRVGIGVNYDGNKFYWTPVVMFDDFTQVSTSTAFTEIMPGADQTWSYDWDPDGGAGFGSLTTILDGETHTIDLTAEQRAKRATMDAFGFAGLAALSSNENWYANIYFDDLTYSVIPESSSLIIWTVLGVFAVAAAWRKRRNRVLCRLMACLVFVSLGCVGQVQAALVRTENFDVDPGWTVVGSGGKNENDFGYQTSSYAGGSPGEAGGRFTRSEFVRYYADTDIGGTMTLDQPFSASGKFACTDAFHPDYGHPFGVGHFSTSGFGMVHIGFTEVDTDDLHWRAGILLDDFTGVGIAPVLVTENVEHTWAYEWDPNGGVAAAGVLTVNLDDAIYAIELSPSDRATGATLDAFGFAGIAAPNRSYPDWYANMYIDDVTYSVVPEPSSFILWLIGVFSLICCGRFWRKWRG